MIMSWKMTAINMISNNLTDDENYDIINVDEKKGGDEYMKMTYPGSLHN